jgi:Uma2 family endonuclease
MLKKYAQEPDADQDTVDGLHASGVPCSRFFTDQVRILDPALCRAIIRERQLRGIDGYDEVFTGVYIVPPIANNPHQNLVGDLVGIFFIVITSEERGRVQGGANVSDRREGWEQHFRAPDVVVVLNSSRAVDCGTHWLGGPDFLVEVQSPGDETEEKIPFYDQLEIRELLIIHRDTRVIRLLRHDGQQLVEVGRSDAKDKNWLPSAVLPLAFRWKMTKAGPRTEVKRTDGKRKTWTI